MASDAMAHPFNPAKLLGIEILQRNRCAFLDAGSGPVQTVPN
jgi:hypothetical protein